MSERLHDQQYPRQQPQRDPLEEALRRDRERDTGTGGPELDGATPRADLWAGIAARLDADQDAAHGSASGEGTASGAVPGSAEAPRAITTDTDTDAPKPETVVRQLRPAPAWQGWMRVAAVLAVVLTAGIWLSRQTPQHGTGPAAADNGPALAEQSLPSGLPEVPESAQRDPQFVELQNVATQYARLADRSGERLLENPALGPEESEIAVAFLADLESDYRELLDDWADGADPDKVLKAMVRNYRQRIELLEHLSNILEPQTAPQNDKRYEDAVVL